MAAPEKRNFKEVEAKVIAKAWKDPAFKKKLLSNPKEALAEMGVQLPANVNVRCIEDTKNSYTFVIPSAESAKLSEAELGKIAGGQNLSSDPGCIHRG